jgi:hypothetical protein
METEDRRNRLPLIDGRNRFARALRLGEFLCKECLEYFYITNLGRLQIRKGYYVCKECTKKLRAQEGKFDDEYETSVKGHRHGGGG